MPPPAPPDVFVSYASKDAAAVHPFAARLAAASVGVWLDKHRIPPGQCFATEIVRGLRSTKVVVLMCSPHSIESPNVKQEVRLGWDPGPKAYLPVWLTPPRPLGDDLDYYLRHSQYIQTAGRHPDEWFADVVRGLGGFGVRRDRPRAPATTADLRAAIVARDWRKAVAVGEALLAAKPDATDVRQAVAAAQAWVDHEDDQVLAAVLGRPTPADWERYLERFCDGPLADHAKFRIASELPLPRLGEFLQRCLAGAPADLNWRVAAAVCQLRLKNRPAARAELEACRTADPGHAAALFYLAVARVAAPGLQRLTLEHLRGVEELTRTAAGLAPLCGYPDLLNALLACEYYEPNRMRSPFGPSAALVQACGAKGLGRDDYAALRGLFD